MAYFLFIAYLLFFIFLVRYLDKKQFITLSFRIALPAILVKVIMACVYGYIFKTYYDGDDTWMYHQQSLVETEFLKSSPLRFLHSLINPTAYTRYMMTTWWQEIEYVSLVKILAILNLFSGGNYYVNAVLFSMISFWGPYLYVCLFNELVPGKRNIYILIFFFFIPLVFWTSGIRKDGLIFLFSGIFFYYFHLFLKNIKSRYLVFAFLGLSGVALNRNFVALSLIPVALAWFLAMKYNSKSWRPFVFVYGIGLVLFFASSYIGPFDLPAAFIKRQTDFLELSGGSFVELDRLENNPLSFIKLFPQAIVHVFFRPIPGEQGGVFYLISALETWFIIIVFLMMFIFPERRKPGHSSVATTLALFVFAITNYLFIGYTVPFLGAIVRYRIIFESIFLALMISMINWKKIIPKSLHNIFI